MNIENIKEKALEDKVPIIMDDTLEVILNMLKEKKPFNLLEIGSAVGYSAICFSEYVENKIDTIEMDELRAEEAKNNIESVNLQNKINLIKGNAVEILPTLNDNDKYDVVFIDAAKSKYPIFLEYALKLTNEDSIIIADNVLYKGYVLGDYNEHKQRTAVRNLREFLKNINENANLEMEILEVGDGLAIIKKTQKAE